MLNKNTTVCFSGHRSERLPKLRDELDNLSIAIYEEIDKAVDDGFDTFIFGACYGFDLMCAKMVLLRQMVVRHDDSKCIRLIAAIPFNGQTAKWNKQNQEIYLNTISKCDEVITISAKFSMNCYHKRNRYMVDNSNRLICYYDGCSSGTRNTVNYANQKDCEVINLYK